MLIRNGIKSCFRERGRTVRFFLLILLLTLALILALGVLLYCSGVIAHCNETYRAVAIAEYMGADYPDEDAADETARAAAASLDLDAIAGVDGMRVWTPGNGRTGYVEGYMRRNGLGPYAERTVITVTSVSRQETWSLGGTDIPYWTATISEILYSSKYSRSIIIDLVPGETDFSPEYGKSYVLYGRAVTTTSRLHPQNGMPVFELLPLPDGQTPYVELEDGDEIPAVFREAAVHERLQSNFVRLTPCADVRDVTVFQQNELHLEAGDFPDPAQPGGCVISPDLAEQLSLEPGDEFTLEGLTEQADDRYALTPDGTRTRYTVCGVASFSYDSCGCVWAIEEPSAAPLFGYLLGTASLESEKCEDAALQLRERMPENVRVTLYDQGYGEAVEPFREVRRVALNVLLVCAAGVLTVLFLFAFLFVGRQSRTVQIMVSLGTQRRKVTLWMLSGALAVTLPAAAAGAAGGVLLQPYLMMLITQFTGAGRVGERFFLYSETELSVTRELEEFIPQIPLLPNVLAAAAIVLTALLLCRLFLLFAYRGGTRKRGKSRVHVPRGRTSTFGFGPWRFARLSIRRGGLRTLVVPLVSAVLTVTVIFLVGVYQGWVNELEAARETTQIDAMAVSLDGRWYSQLTVPAKSVRTLKEVELAEDVTVSRSFCYWLPDEIPAFSSGYGAEHREAWIQSQPKLCALDSLRAAQAFYYAEPQVTWLDGWDESMLKMTDLPLLLNGVVDEPLAYPALMGDEFLQAHGLALGDELDCFVWVDGRYGVLEVPLRLTVVGSYRQNGGKSLIYVPLSAYVPPSVLSDEAEEMTARYYQDKYKGSTLEEYLAAMASFETCRFRLASARNLETLRHALYETGFSAVGLMNNNRTTLVLSDAAYLRFTQTMERNIAVGQAMGAAIAGLLILVGFFVSWLMTNARKREFALMRGFGASKRRVFASFFREQLLLCLLGCGLGCVSLTQLCVGGWLQPCAAAGFFVCYLIGCAAAIRSSGRINLMALLSVKD